MSSLENYWSLVSETLDVKSSPACEMTITKFLSCFEVVTASQKKSNNEATTSRAQQRSLQVRKNISSETLAKLGRLAVESIIFYTKGILLHAMI